MKKGWIVIIVLVAILALGIFSLVGAYNDIATQQEAVGTAFSNIQTQLQRRADLVPNLVETVKGYTSHEEEVMTAIADARSAMMAAGNMGDLAAANDSLTSALSRLMVVVENYPDLKADATYISLMDELAGTENRISTARTDYNTAAQQYNTEIIRFPKNLLAAIFNFKRADYFEASDEAQTAPEVSFE